MGRAQYRLKRDVTKEQGKIGKAGAKRGLWSKIGMTLGGLIAIGLTGGAAAPAVAALAAAAGTAAGGFAGRGLAAKSKGGKIRGGKFFQDEREDLISTETEGIVAGALKSGLTAGAASYMGGVSPKLGWSSKGGFSITAGGGGKVATAGTEAAATAGGEGFPGMISKAFSPKGGGSAHTYSDTLLGKVGKALDVKGSAIGSRVGEGVKKIQVAQMRKKGEALRTAQSENLMQFSEAQGPPLPPTEAPIVGGEFDPESYRILKEGEALRKTEYLDSLLPNNSTYYKDETAIALENLRNEAGYNLGSEQEIMEAAMEGYNTPVGQGYDPGDELFRQQNRGAFMDDLQFERDLDSRLGRSFKVSSPDLLEGYDPMNRTGQKHKDMAFSSKWHQRLFPNK